MKDYVTKNKKFIDSLIETKNEIKIYFLIDGLGGIIWRLNHDMGDGRIEKSEWPKLDKDIVLMAEVQQYAVAKLLTFGVNNPYLDEKKNPGPEYWAWFHWWNDYIKGMPEEEWRILDNKMSDNEDISTYRPAGSWQTNLANSKKNDDITI
jgi:hypothetical protein